MSSVTARECLSFVLIVYLNFRVSDWSIFTSMSLFGPCPTSSDRIPARSPDLNPIENIFHLIKKKLAKQALNLQIEKESFEEFKTRVLRCCNDIDPLIIDRTIESLPKRIDAILKGRGCRTKY